MKVVGCPLSVHGAVIAKIQNENVYLFLYYHGYIYEITREISFVYLLNLKQKNVSVLPIQVHYQY